jgi:hypothetical protein
MPLFRSAVALVAVALFLVSFTLIANGKPRVPARSSVDIVTTTRVLMIGDSLSAGPFGEAVQQHLASKFGPQNVAAFASCGSSPEHWLTDEPGFYTHCGYRESTPDKLPIYRDFVDGKPPRPTLTPKVAALVSRYRPTVVIVQLGTNWMDRDLSEETIGSITERFIREARGPSVRQIIWVAPPDSSAFRKTQGRVHRLIDQAAARDHFDVIDSRDLTHYIPGKTGGDGIHYNTEASRVWAAKLSVSLDAKLRGRSAATR